MAVLKTDGRADIAAAYKALAETRHNYMVAFGPGEGWWGSQQSVLLGFGDDDTIQIPTAHLPTTSLSLRSADGTTPYQLGPDYVADGTAGVITRNPAGQIDPEALVQITYVAAIPQPDLTTQALVSETGRVSVGAVQYVVPFDEAEDALSFVIVDGSKYALVAGPSRTLLFTAHLSATDGVGDPIREYALFSRCAVDPDLPPGQSYFEPHLIADPGTLVVSRFRTPVPHDGTVGLDMSIIIEI
ncbi:hypothetical protein [Castellaniella sp.]|uniref:hypothetical protein n=1 Tax=Castellaniella sp. TaxID=1955812 RepID=UPI002AFFB998|nr:hypothetical protein [Castellaniella sp.]